ncbi:hypothetical protein O6H91_02G058500 [Diphasiastrum complanatum]|uniref:Uncharacterized protein n=3 Tax=Diphasiastrum complanatum TaxID=34168 RepID=A0ACC2EG61_DIPCM|nr:hypothetical protein O6H91_02G058500 [Diphasiastrum complanatum]KAJ7565389.1 hypothetical protein O6H91_02G058500 [Diphasiastrum complanatum]KAJ7565390.1 hypothetical protein O6H91_02G058500 [Diphasiastrum complanatum]
MAVVLSQKWEASPSAVLDVVLECIFQHLEDPQDRKAVSQVCSHWYRIDGITRRHVEIPFCYSVSPSALARRFKRLDSVKLKGKPRAQDFNFLPEDWGGNAEPWVNEIVRAYPSLSKLHFKRMEVTDEDLGNLAHKLGNSLEVLKLDYCSGFSTLGILEIALCCRHIKVINLEESEIIDESGKWLHELAQHHSELEVLNFAMTGLEKIDIGDLEMLVENCKSLSCLKVGEVDANNIRRVLSKATVLQEFAMVNGIVGDNNLDHGQEGRGAEFDLPKTLNSLSGDILLPLSPVVASKLKKLNLKPAFLSPEGHLEVLRYCINLEVLEVRNIIGDDGLDLLANTCKKLQRLRIEHAYREGPGIVSHKSLVSLAQNCIYLNFLVLYVSDISNAAVAAFGQFCPLLVDFRLVLVDSNEFVSELPLDNGILALMKGCENLTRICVYLRYGGLTDTGLAHIGRHGGKLKWALLGCVGDSDQGLKHFALGCQKLEKLEMRDCPFSEAGLSEAVLIMRSLKFLWVEYCNATENCTGFTSMQRPFWNMEHYQGSQEHSKQLLAYRSLAGVRNDQPYEIVLLRAT